MSIITHPHLAAMVNAARITLADLDACPLDRADARAVLQMPNAREFMARAFSRVPAHITTGHIQRRIANAQIAVEAGQATEADYATLTNDAALQAIMQRGQS